jgi:hypothetical protein
MSWGFGYAGYSNKGNYYLICLECSGSSDEIIHIQELAPQNFLK